MAAPTSTSSTEPRNRRIQEDNRSVSRAPSEGGRSVPGKGAVKKEAKAPTFMDRWVEPALAAPKPSYQDHGAAAYGVVEHMQPLGEAPNAKVKARVKADGARKSVLGGSSAAVDTDARETPEGSPAPPHGASQPPESMDAYAQQPIVIDDDRDDDYAPANGKKKDRTTRSRQVKRKSESASSATPAAPAVQEQSASLMAANGLTWDLEKLKHVVDAAKARALEVGGSRRLADAVQEIYEQSVTDFGLRRLLEAILGQQATAAQQAEFQQYVKAAKRKLKEDAKNESRQLPATSTNGDVPQPKPLPSPSPAVSTAPAAPTAPQITVQPASEASAALRSPIPSTELPEASKPKISLKVKSPSKKSTSHQHRSGQSSMSVSPRKRAGSAASDSSLTDLTSNDGNNDMDVDEPALNNAGVGSYPKVNGTKGKDHAAERGSLAVAPGAAKRSSADAEFEDERDRALAAKKQKLNETVAREYNYQESNLRPDRPPRSRLARVKEDARATPSLRLESTGSRAASTRGSRAPSLDIDSPLTDLSPAASRQSTPAVWKAPARAPGKRAKTKQSPEKKQQGVYGGMPGAGGAGRESPIGDDDNEEQLSENNDFCSACKLSGFLLCCDGCSRSFHFDCLDPPLSETSKELDEPWFCFKCSGKPLAESSEKPLRGLFAPLLGDLKTRNPTTFELPEEVRNYFEGVVTDSNGAFSETLLATKATRSRPGYSEDQPDYFKLRDNKQNLVHCYSCSKTSQGKRAIVTCDYCGQHWHLDCLDPPLANPPALNQNGRKVHDWMCPLHVEQELRRMDPSFLSRPRRTIHIRRPRFPRLKESALSRGIRNNGIIELIDDSEVSDGEFYDHEENDTIYKLPAQGIKLDFIDKVKQARERAIYEENAYKRFRMATADHPSALEQANFAKRPFIEQQVALQLAQFASQNQDLELGHDQVQNLVGTLIAEAPTEVVDEFMAAEGAEKAKSTSSAIPPSPPSSEQPDQITAEQRQELLLLQELIKRRLESSKT